MVKMRFPRLDVAAVLAVFGDSNTDVVAKLRTAGIDSIGVKAVDKWSERGVIPMARWLELVHTAKFMGRALPLENYLIWS